jgi:outer membrane protein TolC
MSAQEKLVLTIEKSIEIGLGNSKSLHSSLMKVQAADSKSGETHTSLLPSLKASGSYNRLSDVPPFAAVITPNELGPGFPPQQVNWTLSQTVLDNYNLRLSLQQPLFTGWRLHSSAQIAEYSAQATEQDYNKDKAELVYNIKSAYWNLYKANEFKKVIDENVEQTSAHLKDVENFYAQGLVTENEVLRVQVQLSNAEVLQLDAQNNAQLSMLALNNTIGISLGTTIELASQIQLQEKTYGDQNALVETALENRPEVRGMDLRVKASESSVSLARSGWLPQIYLAGNYYYARPNSRIFPTVDQFRDTWDMGISVSMDVWNWGTTVYQTNQAQAQLAQAQDALGQLRDAINLEVTQGCFNLSQSKAKLAVAEKGVRQAEENHRVTYEKFKSGLALNSDLLDAEAALLQAKWNRIQATVDRELADARLQKAIGQDSSSITK